MSNTWATINKQTNRGKGKRSLKSLTLSGVHALQQGDLTLLLIKALLFFFLYSEP